MNVRLSLVAASALLLSVACNKKEVPASTSTSPALPTKISEAPALKLNDKDVAIERLVLSRTGSLYTLTLQLGGDAKVKLALGDKADLNEKIERTVGVSYGVKEGDGIQNFSGPSKLYFMRTGGEFGTVEQPGKCSGEFSAALSHSKAHILTSGHFSDIDCIAH